MHDHLKDSFRSDCEMDPKIPQSLADLCKRRYLLLDLNDDLHKELRSLRSYVSHMDQRQTRYQLAHDRIKEQQDRRIQILQEQVQSQNNLIKSLQSYGDWWSSKWTHSNNDRQRLMRENYVLRSRIQDLESQLALYESRSLARKSKRSSCN